MKKLLESLRTFLESKKISRKRMILVLILIGVLLLLILIGLIIFNRLETKAIADHPLVLIHTPDNRDRVEIGQEISLHATARSQNGIARIELWADFSKYPIGTSLELVSKYFEDVMQESAMGPRRGMMGGDNLPNGAPFSVLKIDVAKKEKETRSLPKKLSSIERYHPRDADNSDNPRQFSFFMRQMHGLINGRTFQMQEVAGDEMIRLNSTELWELSNDDRSMGMMMMPMPHPVHLHGKQFQVVGRSGALHRGYVDEGWKDTVLLMPGERARIVTNFTDYKGLFLYHCHILEHGDMGMMRNYLVA